MGSDMTQENSVGYFDDAVKSIAEGRSDSLAELYATLKKPVFVFALSILQDYQEAEDVMQETFLRVAAKSSDYRPGTNARAWIFSIARNLSLDILKRKKPVALTEDVADSGNFEEKAASAIDFLRMLRVLNENERQIVVMHFYGGLRKAEIAKLLGVPSANVRVTYGRALKKLKNSLK